VESLWGTEQNQSPPQATYQQINTKVESIENNKVIKAKSRNALPFLAAQQSHRCRAGPRASAKGLFWYSTYKVSFGGVYFQHNR
jgi:hypothetical protein